ncbi:MAG: type II and III secretion system protein family protein, partial [Gammaproteobacteria bacterium]|jgi:pilus assembly protein CpaC
VLGKDLGTTNVLLWDRGDSLIGSVAVEVTHDLESLKEKFFELMPNEDISVYAAQRSIVLSGSVSSPMVMDAALSLAEGYLAQVGTAVESQEFEQQSAGTDGVGGEVVNLLQVAGAQQVMLEVKVAEIARSELRKFDMQFNALDVGSGEWTAGALNGGGSLNTPPFTVDPSSGLPGNGLLSSNPLTIDDTGFFASYLSGNTLLNMTLDAARENGLARILAEPTLTTLSGQEAQFLSGGEFPIPVPQGVNGVTIEFKEFGVGLRFVPVVLGEGQISLALSISVSELTESNTVAISVDGATSTFVVPSVTKRSASATVELLDGQTMGIAGLISEDLREVVNKFPGLGSIPLLGNLFRSQEFIKGESELVILVTPRLAQPMRPDQIRLPTDNFIEPNAKEFYLMGKLEGKPRDDEASGSAAGSDGGVDSDFGHEID